MEWGTILIMGILVLFATYYLCAGLMDDFSLILTVVGLALSAGAIYCLVELFKVSLGNGFTGLGIGIVVAIICFFSADSLRNESISDWIDWMD